MPRPKPVNPLHMVSHKITDEDHQKLSELAQKEGVSKSAMVRLLIRRSYDRRVKS